MTWKAYVVAGSQRGLQDNVHSGASSFLFGCALGLLCDLRLVAYSLWATFFFQCII